MAGSSDETALAREHEDAQVAVARPWRRVDLARLRTSARSRQQGMVTAEYAVGAVAAAGFAGVLIKVLTDPHVFDLLLRIISWLLGLVTGQNVL